MLSSHVFASRRSNAIHSVHVGGRLRVRSGRHEAQARAVEGLVSARHQLLQERP
jgi:formimidoylglutamate deiminase